MNPKKWIVLVFGLLVFQTSVAQDFSTSLPILVIGASYSEAKPPYNNGLSPRGGGAVAFGSFLSLGEALTRDPRLPGFVINEGQAGATTFARQFCPPTAPVCAQASWDSYRTQLEHALTRVAIPGSSPSYNAAYVVITAPNDCLHSGAAGVPQAQSAPCTAEQLNQVADRLIAVGQFAFSKGIIPIYDVLPRYEDVDLSLFRQQNALPWVIGEADYRWLRENTRQRLQSELPAAVVLDMWKNFVQRGDGLHPDYDTTKRAAKIVAKAITGSD